MNAYSNTGELTLTSHAEKIGLDGNVTTDSRYYGSGLAVIVTLAGIWVVNFYPIWMEDSP